MIKFYCKIKKDIITDIYIYILYAPYLMYCGSFSLTEQIKTILMPKNKC